MTRPPVWKLFECGGGSRFSSVALDTSGETCEFSGCNCGTKVRVVKTTESREEAHNWFRRPVVSTFKQE